jgi:GT2 family glycosyltransferase
MLKVSVIIVSFNTLDITEKCLRHLVDSNLKNKEIIVVDNASSDGSAQMITQKFPEVKLIKSDKNLGFTGGNNLGLKQASGEFILLLNTDAFVQPDTLDKCLEIFSKHPDYDVLGCKLTFADGTFQPSAGYLPNPLNTFLWVWGVDVLPLFKQMIHSVHPQGSEFFKAREVGWITGAFMFMKRVVYEKTSGLDEHFFMYMEEIEWCKRIYQAGYKIWYEPSIEIVHLMGASNNFDLSQAYFKEMQGLIYFFKKHYPELAGFMKLLIRGGNLARVIAFTIVGMPDRAETYKQILASL